MRPQEECASSRRRCVPWKNVRPLDGKNVLPLEESASSGKEECASPGKMCFVWKNVRPREGKNVLPLEKCASSGRMCFL